MSWGTPGPNLKNMIKKTKPLNVSNKENLQNFIYGLEVSKERGEPLLTTIFSKKKRRHVGHEMVTLKADGK